MRRNQHKRLGKRQNQFIPTWTGQAVEPTSALLPPVVTTPDAIAQPTTSQVLPLPNLPTSSIQLPPVLQTSTSTSTTSSPQTPATTAATTQPQAPVPTTAATQSTSSPTSLLTSSTESTTSTSSLSSSTLSTSAAATSTPEPTLVPTLATTTTTPATTTRAAATTTTPRISSSTVRATSSFTDSDGVVRQTIVVVTTAATPTATDAPKDSSNAGTIVGAIAGGFVGLICLVAFVSWIIRQHHKRKQGNHDDFDRQSYMRNSQMIPDDVMYDHPVRGTQAALALARSNTSVGPRPPTMIERKNTYFGHSQVPPSFAPGQVVSFEPGQIVSGPASAVDPAYPSPVAFAGYTPPDQHHETELVRRPSGAQLLNRAPTNGAMYDNGPYPHTPSPVSYGPGPESYGMHTPDTYSYGHDGYTYPMHPGVVDHRGMVQSVTPYQAQQYAEITRQLEGSYENDSFHPMSPVGGPASPISQPMARVEIDSPTTGSPKSVDDKHLPNPFDELSLSSSHQRIDSTPPALPPIESLSRTGTPIDPNPQHAHWSYDAKSAQEGHRLSVAGMLMPEPPTPPPAAVLRSAHPVDPVATSPSAVANAPAPANASPPAPANGAAQPAKRPLSTFDVDDAYGGM
ncbi:hypothetical protein BN14_08650 [Rhizoctonia solani AG-1 IB]|uniref:Transmembrane protein n=1 Tax=Thanatephorus cucumeris (strain AG1-IB / isolate 7/3/14) TaxID=1108050 RepID=M5C3L7_THACB|nr:hypothetical protein BN14_08650 [Rhizoctonia solani AG-1 IB]